MCIRAVRILARPGDPAVAESPSGTGARVVQADEADLPAQEAQARPDAWVSGANADARWAGDPQAPAAEGPQAADAIVTRSERERKRRGRLSRSGDFERAYREGRSHSNRFLIMYAFARPETEPGGVRLGVSVGRKLGGAVERNRLKRTLREALRELAGRLPDDHDFVIVARPDLAGLIERDGTEAARACLEEVIRDGGFGRRIV
jgi:ribonuclease P protein component